MTFAQIAPFVFEYEVDFYQRYFQAKPQREDESGRHRESPSKRVEEVSGKKRDLVSQCQRLP